MSQKYMTFAAYNMMISIAFTIVLSLCVASATREPSPTIVPVVGGVNGTGITTGYWDCCKPSCSWRGNLRNTTKDPVYSCGIDGDTVIDPEAMSSCGDGPAYMCTNQQPFVVNTTLAYGYAAASFTGSTDYQLCCGCVLLSFLGELAGKQMLVQVTNAGGDLRVNQFDLAIPGAGVGYFNGCKSQWNAPVDGWGRRYGGVTTEAECDQLPKELQGGCRFRFGFMEGANVPNVTFVQVECPKELVAVTGCEL